MIATWSLVRPGAMRAGQAITMECAVRAARLIIEEGALDGDGANVETLAARVGVGARHLARLFAKHLGATPSQVAKTARVQRAKRPLDGTDMPMTEVALRAGFSSHLRRADSIRLQIMISTLFAQTGYGLLFTF